MQLSRSAVLTLVRFLAVGASGAAAYVGLASAATALGIVPWLASLVSYIVLIPIVYLAQKHIAFESKGSARSSFPKYVATQAIGLTLSVALPYFLHSLDGVPPAALFVAVAFIIAMTNFVLLRFWTFKPQL